MLGRTDQWAYRIPYALQWMWPVPLLVGIFLAPESPWWLVRKGRTEEAKKSLLRLTSLNKEANFDADETVAMMVHTTALEEKVCLKNSVKFCYRELMGEFRLLLVLATLTVSKAPTGAELKSCAWSGQFKT